MTKCAACTRDHDRPHGKTKCPAFLHAIKLCDDNGQDHSLVMEHIDAYVFPPATDKKEWEDAIEDLRKDQRSAQQKMDIQYKQILDLLQKPAVQQVEDEEDDDPDSSIPLKTPPTIKPPRPGKTAPLPDNTLARKLVPIRGRAQAQAANNAGIRRSFSSPPARQDDVDKTQGKYLRSMSPDHSLDAALRRDMAQARMAMDPDIREIDGREYFAIKKDTSYPKPSDFLPIRARKRAQKEEYTCTIEEQINGLARMAMRQPEANMKYFMNHIGQISEDAMTHEWEDVVEWSDTVFELLASDDFTWKDHTIIQEERSKLSRKRLKAPPIIMEVPCKDWNDQECDEKEKSHENEIKGVKLSHICAICYYSTGRKVGNHQAKTCFHVKQGNHGSQGKFNKKGGAGKKPQHTGNE